LEEDDTSNGICSTLTYKEKDVLLAQMKLETFVGVTFDTRPEEQQALLHKVAYPDAALIPGDNEWQTVPAIEGTRIEFSLTPNENAKFNHGLLFVGHVTDEWFTGSVCVTYVFEQKNRKSLCFRYRRAIRCFAEASDRSLG